MKNIKLSKLCSFFSGKKGLLFRCVNCFYECHADLLGARNVCMRTLLARQDWTSTGCLSASPNASSDEAKALNRCQFSELRWTIDASPTQVLTNCEWVS